MTAEADLLAWLPLLVLAPLLGAVACVFLPRTVGTIGLVTGAGVAAASLSLAVRVASSGPVTASLGGWQAPLGIDLQADGLSALMVAMTACVGLLVSLSVTADPKAGRGAAFWPLWLTLLAGLNAVYLSGDAFTIYVALEIIGLSGVGLAVLTGTPAALRAGFTYLCAGLVGSLLFLLGVHYLYATHGRVDLAGLAPAAGAAASLPLALMFAGMALKTAIFPLHFWLPAAHSSATPPASAILSGLVLKASLYVAFRLWRDVFVPAEALALLVGLLGTAGVIWGSIQAIRTARLKLLVAYSTVAQIGMICLAFAIGGSFGAETAFHGAVYLMLAHAIAKAAMFLAAGRIAQHLGHDRIADLDLAASRPGAAQAAFALAAVSLIGLPPTAGFVGKWLLVESAIRTEGWFWVAVLVAGTALSAAYLTRVVAQFLRHDRVVEVTARPQWLAADAAPMSLALLSLALGLAAAGPLALLGANAPVVLMVAP